MIEHKIRNNLVQRAFCNKQLYNIYHRDVIRTKHIQLSKELIVITCQKYYAIISICTH